MKLTKEELLNSIKDKFNEDTSDETLKFIEDVTDTINSYEDNSKEDWKAKYEQNDAEWRQRYKERFFQNNPVTEEPIIEDKQEEVLSYEALLEKLS